MRVTNPAVEDSSSRSIVVITHALDTSKALPEAGGDKYSEAATAHTSPRHTTPRDVQPNALLPEVEVIVQL